MCHEGGKRQHYPRAKAASEVLCYSNDAQGEMRCEMKRVLVTSMEMVMADLNRMLDGIKSVPMNMAVVGMGFDGGGANDGVRWWRKRDDEN